MRHSCLIGLYDVKLLKWYDSVYKQVCNIGYKTVEVLLELSDIQRTVMLILTYLEVFY